MYSILVQLLHPSEAEGYREAIKAIRHIGCECILRRFKAVANNEEVPNDILTQIIRIATSSNSVAVEDLVDDFVTFFIAGKCYKSLSLLDLIFVVLNFVALEDCTCHAPFAIIKQPTDDCHRSDRNRNFPVSYYMFDDCRDSTDWRQMPCVLTMIACTLAATLPDDLYLLWQTFMGCKFHDCQSSHKNNENQPPTKITRYTILL